MTGIPLTVDYLHAGWGQAYLFGYARDRWIAIRRDGIWFLAADTLAALGTEIEADQRKTPLLAGQEDPRDLARDYLTTGHPATEPRPGEAAGVIDAAEVILRQAAAKDPVPLAELRASFPALDIHFSGQLHAWIARRDRTTVCEGSPVLLRIALTLIERRQPSSRHGPVP